MKKFAFLVHDPIMLVHYADVWKAMDPSDFAIILTEDFSVDVHGKEKLGSQEFFNYVQIEGYEVRQVMKILRSRKKYEYVVTNHMISVERSVGHIEKQLNRGVRLLNRSLRSLKVNANRGESGIEVRYLPQQVGIKQIRYMYGADISDGWSLQSWNDIYDVFLCHGVNDEREIKNRFKGKTYIMGYPRYDRFFSGDLDLSSIKREFGLSESKKTILWMPTLGGEYSSIPLFAEPLSAISKKYDIIVRPHPFSFVQERDFISLLEKWKFNIDRNALRDMNELFGVADVILADNGGTPFSAIFLGKNVIFLNVPDDLGGGSAATSYIAGSSVMELKKHLPVVKHQDIHLLEHMLDSREFYEENTRHIEALFKRYFDSPRGGGAKRVVDIFKSL
jgi:CDP-Glycerol:Poly(glycerophosphate) glycerophosphotransferase